MAYRLRVAVVADDLTGAADTGVQFCAAARPLFLRPIHTGGGAAAVENAEGLALFTDSRHDSPEVAGRKVRAAAEMLRERVSEVVYKKIDSCLRGNLGAETDALLEALGCRVSFVAPALPGQGRTTENDVHRDLGVPVGESEISRDPLCPVTESRLSRLLAAQSRYPVGRVALGEVASGPERLRDVIRSRLAEGCRHLTFDAVETAHLDAVAAAAVRFFPEALLVGSAGLAASLAALLPPSGWSGDPWPPRRLDRMLWVCGSASAVLQRQIAALADRAGVEPVVLPAPWLAGTPDLSGQLRIVDRVAENWTRGVRLVGIEHPSPSAPQAAPRAVAAGLAEVAVAIVNRTQPDGILLTGGDTAQAVWRQLGAKAVSLGGEVLPGVILGRWIGGAMDGRAVLTKAGAFGGEDTLADLFQSLLER